MASINYAAREISVKIVYYGPGLSGKTTNLQVIHRKVPTEFKSDMVSLATETDRTLFFDFLPLDLGKIKGFATKFQLYTVPGQVYYNATRKLVLRGVDGVVFVADSAPDKMQENIESFQNLEDNLAEYGYKRETIPIIIQYNKRDLPNALPVEEMQRLFNKYNLAWSEAVANKGKGVFDSLKLIGKIVIDYLNKKYSRTSKPSATQSARPMQQGFQQPQQQFGRRA
ncbi:MAG: ADP-ribosylation factor-like protein, partial [Fibrobacter sp.]|nr:ADP-ribosylation factor-like protein [Fibrobacter sp.]